MTINACGGTRQDLVEYDRTGGRKIRELEYDGPSLLLVHNPHGELEAESGEDVSQEQMLLHSLKSEAVAARRSDMLFQAKFRRPEIYGNLSKTMR